MILPERTVDIWTALVIARAAPGSLMWAPTTNSQAIKEPWDLDVRLGWKILLLENKGLDDQRQVRIDGKQLGRLIKLDAVLPGTVFYGLPLDVVPSAPSVMYQRFSRQQRLVSPRALYMLSNRKGPATDFILRQGALAGLPNQLLGKSIRDVLACRKGYLLPAGEGRQAMVDSFRGKLAEALGAAAADDSDVGSEGAKRPVPRGREPGPPRVAAVRFPLRLLPSG